jgi:hypothetical protein
MDNEPVFNVVFHCPLEVNNEWGWQEEYVIKNALLNMYGGGMELKFCISVLVVSYKWTFFHFCEIHLILSLQALR